MHWSLIVKKYAFQFGLHDASTLSLFSLHHIRHYIHKVATYIVIMEYFISYVNQAIANVAFVVPLWHNRAALCWCVLITLWNIQLLVNLSIIIP